MRSLSETSITANNRDIRVLIMVLIPLVWLVWLSVEHGVDSSPPAIKRISAQQPVETDGKNLSWYISALKPGAPGQAVDSARQAVLASIFQMEKIPINLVDVELLQTVPGIGEQLATRLVKERQAHGPFKSAEDLMRVTGIGISRSQQFQKVLRFD